ncbi:MAG: hypothetical protein HQ498_06550 [Pseudohongiella sp.]|nr:hypothetical protein [Pseudohongiella sp.]
MKLCRSLKSFLDILLRNFPTATALVIIAILESSTLIAADAEQEVVVVKEYIESEQRLHFDALLAEFGQHKELPINFELQTLLALSHYPELKDIKIRFIIDDVGIPLSSRPHWASMLRSASNRSYQVIMDSNLEGPRDVLLLKNQPFNAQIGIIGHELAHTVYYLNRSFWGIIADALCQLNACRIDFERATDRRLISYGLGWQRYDHATFVRRRFAPDPKSNANAELSSTTEVGRGAYMSPEELLAIMRNIDSYAD